MLPSLHDYKLREYKVRRICGGSFSKSKYISFRKNYKILNEKKRKIVAFDHKINKENTRKLFNSF